MYEYKMVRAKTTEEVRAEVEAAGETLDPNFVYTSSKDTNNKLPITCQHCGEVYHATRTDFLAGTRCKCQTEIRRILASSQPKKQHTKRTTQDMIDEIEQELYTVIKLIPPDKGVWTIFKVECASHHKYKTTFHNFITVGSRCKRCSDQEFRDMYKLPLSEAKIIAKNANVVMLDENYDNMHDNIDFDCLVCKTRFTSTLALVKESGCNLCNASLGEQIVLSVIRTFKSFGMISKFKKEDNAEKQCLMTNCLRFDFMILVYGVIGFIEFDGKQHFEPIDYFGGTSLFNKTRKSDLIKTRYCILNDIPLLRISYLEIKEIESYVIDFIIFLIKLSQGIGTEDILHYSNQELYQSLLDEL